jgi:hypothetical protein
MLQSKQVVPRPEKERGGRQEKKHNSVLQRSLGDLVGFYRNLQQSIGNLDRELAYWLARTP